jgi:tRNA modification GTPase
MTSAAPLRFAVLTPSGQGAVATIRIEGALAPVLLQRHFVGRVPTDDTRPAFGLWRRGESDTGEEVVIRVISATSFEVHCHGGPAAIAAISGDAKNLGGFANAGGQFRTHQAADVGIARALTFLPDAPTERTAAILLIQAQGAWSRAMQEVDRLIASGEIKEARSRLHRLRSLAPLGEHLTRPFRVVLAGRPNVGKSSLLNALLGYERAIVFDQPGTTRDAVTSVASFDGWPVELIDTAGVRDSLDPVEREGVTMSRRQVEQASAVVLIFDSSEPATDDDRRLLAEWPHAFPILNKSDLPRRFELAQPNWLAISARTRDGIDELIQQLVNTLVPIVPEIGEAVPICEEHRAEIEQRLSRF